MAERIYSSDGVVLKKEGIGENSLSILLLTPTHGLVRLRAQGARKGLGKLRFALEPMTFGHYSFIDGKYGMRLVGAQASEIALPPALSGSRRALGNITRLLVRLLPGEEGHEKLFTSVTQGFKYLRSCEEVLVQHAECVLVLTILRELGYLPEDPLLMRFAADSLSDELVREMGEAKPHAVRTINRVLAESGL